MSDKVPTANEVLAPLIEAVEGEEIIGERVGGEPASELEHFYTCKACGQLVDMRDLAAVFHHEEPGHQPLSAADAERLVRVSEQLRAALNNPA